MKINYKLIKTNEGYIIISDEGVQEKDWIYSYPNLDNKFKTLASTYLNGLPNIDFNGFEQRVNFNNVELLAKEYVRSSYYNSDNQSYFNPHTCEKDFIAGFNKCLKINKDKLYTVEQMKEFAIEVTHANPITSIDEHFNNFIKYLKPNVDDFVVEFEGGDEEDGLFIMKKQITK